MRTASVERITKETSVKISLTLDASGTGNIDTGIGFFDHMLQQLARYAFMDLTVEAKAIWRWIPIIPWRTSASCSDRR